MNLSIKPDVFPSQLVEREQWFSKLLDPVRHSALGMFLPVDLTTLRQLSEMVICRPARDLQLLCNLACDVWFTLHHRLHYLASIGHCATTRREGSYRLPTRARYIYYAHVGNYVDMEHSYTDGELLDELRKLAGENGETPSITVMDDEGRFNSGTYQSRFGSWNRAIEEAGLEPNVQKISESELIDEIRRLADVVGGCPQVSDMANLGEFGATTYFRHFGSWSTALESAGFDTQNSCKNVSDGELVRELNRLSAELDKVPSVSDMRRDGGYDPSTYQRRFGSWSRAVQDAGLKFSHDGRWGISRGDLIDELVRLYDDLGRSVRVEDMRNQGRFGTGSYYREFGSWNTALDIADIPLNVPGREATDEDLIDEVRRVGSKAGRVPRYEDLVEYGMYCPDVYRDTFGSWADALDEAGYDPIKPEDYILSGEDHPDWAGGRVPYGPGWNDSKKELVRERDGRVCQDPACGRTEDEHIAKFGIKHHVHHIVKARDFDDSGMRNHPDNLITLCAGKCHAKWEKLSPLRPDGSGGGPGVDL